MSKDTVMEARNPEKGTRDDVTDLLCEGAKRLTAEAVDAELSATLAQFADYKDEACHRHVVRNGYLPETRSVDRYRGVSMRVPKIAAAHGSALLSPYLRRVQCVEEVLPWLCLKGKSTGAMQDALEASLGPRSQRSVSAVYRIYSGSSSQMRP